MRINLARFQIALVALAVGATTSCAPGRRLDSYLPVGAGAQYGNTTNDGIAFTLRLSEADALTRAESALARAGYLSDSTARRSRAIRSGSRTVAGDTTMRVTVEVLSLEPSAPGSSVVVTADYSTPSGKQRRRPVVQEAGTINPLFQQLREFARTIARDP